MHEVSSPSLRQRVHGGKQLYRRFAMLQPVHVSCRSVTRVHRSGYWLLFTSTSALVVLQNLMIAPPALAQEMGSIQGVVTSKATRESIVGVNVVIEGMGLGVATDSSGRFVMLGVPLGIYRLHVSRVGYRSVAQDVNVAGALTFDVALEKADIMSEMIVVSASRKPEKITDAPSTISAIDARVMAELPSFNSGELIARQKGVDYYRSGVARTGMNARGFNSVFNSKTLYINDSRISTLIAIGLPIGPAGTIVKEDIERTEIVLGPSSALYGPNAHNALVNTVTKDPRASEGTTVVLGGGSQEMLTGRFRHANVLNPQFAYKVSGEYTQGVDFDYVDTVYVNRRGFGELDLDRRFEVLKAEASLYFSPDKESDLILTYGGTKNNSLNQSPTGRTQIRGGQAYYLQGRYVSQRIFAHLYQTWGVSDNTYNIAARTQNYRSFIDAGFSEDESRARSFTEAWTGSRVTGKALNKIALTRDHSRRINGEVQYNNEWYGLNVILGVQWQRDLADSRGTILLDQGGPIILDQVGSYAQVEHSFGESGFKTILAARADHHELYGFNMIPKAAVLYTSNNGTWRLTYGKGVAAPTILNLKANVFGGQILGNGEGFTLSNGTKIPKLDVETVHTIELGYKGIITERLFLDANAYYNISKNFLSPLVNIARGGALVTHRGSQAIQELVPGTPAAGASFVQTFLNFGKVNTYGFDLGVVFSLGEQFRATLNYSYFNYSFDKNDARNDGDQNGKVEDTDLPINTPRHKASLGVNAHAGKWFGTVFMRYVQAYDFFSGINVAAKTNRDLIYNGSPVVENTRVGGAFNYGPLGGFVNVDVSAGFQSTDHITISALVVNLFDAKVREFVASPVIGRMGSIELKCAF